MRIHWYTMDCIKIASREVYFRDRPHDHFTCCQGPGSIFCEQKISTLPLRCSLTALPPYAPSSMPTEPAHTWPGPVVLDIVPYGAVHLVGKGTLGASTGSPSGSRTVYNGAPSSTPPDLRNQPCPHGGDEGF